jgi:hypothetical protein
MIAVWSYPQRVSTQTMGQAEEFSAAAFDVNSGQTGRVDISVTRWSTTAERDQLVNALFEKGQDRLLRELQNMRPVGRIHSPGSIGYELRYAEQRRLPEGGREVVLATDRPMSFWEVSNQPRSSQYPFTWVRLTLGSDGTGQGELAVAAKIIGDKDDRQIEVETFELQPVKLQNVTSRTESAAR